MFFPVVFWISRLSVLMLTGLRRTPEVSPLRFWNNKLAFLLLVACLTTAQGLVPASAETMDVNGQDGQQAGLITGRLQYAGNVYRIQPGDRLSVVVYNQPDLSSGNILVRSDGYASFNGVGEISVAGKTISEVTSQLRDQTAKLVKKPYITLSVSNSAPPVIYMAGAVMKPGSVQLISQSESSGKDADSIGSARMSYRLSSAISAAGGVKLNADLARVEVAHQNNAYESVNLLNLIQSGDPSADIILQSGDSVFIPELSEVALDDETYRLLLRSSIGPQSFPVRVVGEVKKVGVYSMDAESPFINSCIAKSGGFKEGAKENLVAVRRFTQEEKFTTLLIDPRKHDFMLRPNDVVYVPSKNTYKAGRFSTNVSHILSPFSTITSSILGIAFLRR
jgi:polysaccharide export outer membrane protein